MIGWDSYWSAQQADIRAREQQARETERKLLATGPRGDVCPGDGASCYDARDPEEAHWRCGTVQCPHDKRLTEDCIHCLDIKQQAREDGEGFPVGTLRAGIKS
jgi:hypothetical protein